MQTARAVRVADPVDNGVTNHSCIPFNRLRISTMADEDPPDLRQATKRCRVTSVAFENRSSLPSSPAVCATWDAWAALLTADDVVADVSAGAVLGAVVGRTGLLGSRGFERLPAAAWPGRTGLGKLNLMGLGLLVDIFLKSLVERLSLCRVRRAASSCWVPQMSRWQCLLSYESSSGSEAVLDGSSPSCMRYADNGRQLQITISVVRTTH